MATRSAGILAGLAGLVTAAAVGRLAVEQRREAAEPALRTHAISEVTPRPVRGLAAAMEQVQPTAPTGTSRVIGWAWAAPTTAVGLVLAATAAGRWRWDPDEGVLVVSGARSPLLAWGGCSANAIGHVIVARPAEPSTALLEHELAHVRQAEVLGPATIPLYLWWLARHGYRDHPMERGARRTARARTGTGTA